MTRKLVAELEMKFNKPEIRKQSKKDRIPVRGCGWKVAANITFLATCFINSLFLI